MYENFTNLCEDTLQWMEQASVPNIPQIFEDTMTLTLANYDFFDEIEEKLNCLEKHFHEKMQKVLPRILEVGKRYYAGIDTNTFVLKSTEFKVNLLEQREWLKEYKRIHDEAWDKVRKENPIFFIAKVTDNDGITTEIPVYANPEDDPNSYMEPETPPYDPLARLKREFHTLRQKYNCEFLDHASFFFTIKDIFQYKNTKIVEKLQVGDKLKWDVVRSSSQSAKLRVLSSSNKILGRCAEENEEFYLPTLIEAIEQEWVTINEIVVDEIEPRKRNKDGFLTGIPHLRAHCIITETEGGKSV